MMTRSGRRLRDEQSELLHTLETHHKELLNAIQQGGEKAAAPDNENIIRTLNTHHKEMLDVIIQQGRCDEQIIKTIENHHKQFMDIVIQGGVHKLGSELPQKVTEYIKKEMAEIIRREIQGTMSKLDFIQLQVTDPLRSNIPTYMGYHCLANGLPHLYIYILGDLKESFALLGKEQGGVINVQRVRGGIMGKMYPISIPNFPCFAYKLRMAHEELRVFTVFNLWSCF